jgi:hypothetical protein
MSDTYTEFPGDEIIAVHFKRSDEPPPVEPPDPLGWPCGSYTFEVTSPYYRGYTPVDGIDIFEMRLYGDPAGEIRPRFGNPTAITLRNGIIFGDPDNEYWSPYDVPANDATGYRVTFDAWGGPDGPTFLKGRMGIAIAHGTAYPYNYIGAAQPFPATPAADIAPYPDVSGSYEYVSAKLPIWDPRKPDEGRYDDSYGGGIFLYSAIQPTDPAFEGQWAVIESGFLHEFLLGPGSGYKWTITAFCPDPPDAHTTERGPIKRSPWQRETL